MLRLPKDATVELVKKAISEHTGVHHKDVSAGVKVNEQVLGGESWEAAHR